MNKKFLYILSVACLFILFTFIFIQTNKNFVVNTSENHNSNLKHITLQDSLLQNEEEYYLYFYKSDCPYCQEVDEKILQLSKKETIYILDCNQEQNRGKKYDWTTSIHDLKQIGFIDDKGEKQFYAQENEQKYLNADVFNKYGKKQYYKVDVMTNEEDNEIICVKMITPEIDYSIVDKWEDIVIAGVPTLLHVTNGKIDEFYFDSPDINKLFFE